MATAPRKSVLYFNSVIPVKDTRDDLVRNKLKPGKFFFTIAGGIKIAGIICLVIAEIMILASEAYCEECPEYKYLLLVSYGITFCATLVLYIIFCSGKTVTHPGRWVKIDMITVLILSVLVVISSAITIADYEPVDTMYQIAAPIGMAGGFILIISCASMFLLYRYRPEEEEDEMEAGPSRAAPKTVPLSRKSVFA